MPAKKILNFDFLKKYIFSFAKNRGKKGESTEKVIKKYENLFANSCPGRFSWFFMVPGWFFMVFHGFRLVFMVSGRFFRDICRFLWFFMVPGWLL